MVWYICLVLLLLAKLKIKPNLCIEYQTLSSIVWIEQFGNIITHDVKCAEDILNSTFLFQFKWTHWKELGMILLNRKKYGLKKNVIKHYQYTMRLYKIKLLSHKDHLTRPVYISAF